MVLIQVDLSINANKKLELYTIYNDLPDKRAALNFLLESLNLKDVRDNFFLKGDEHE